MSHFMKSIIKDSIIFILIILLFIYKSFFIKKISDDVNENTLYLENVKLKDEINMLYGLNLNNYNLSKIAYYDAYDFGYFYIYNNFKINSLVFNDDGLVGIVDSNYNGYSKVKSINNIKNLNIKINNNFGTISEYSDGYIISKNFSNMDDIHVNDYVYTLNDSFNKNEIFVGTVYKIIEKDINKIIYIKSNVNVFDLDYLYVVGD